MKKLNKKQKEHIKKVFVKTINIFCYVCTGILAIILLVVCLQGCQAKRLNSVSAESYDNNNKVYYHLVKENWTYSDGKYTLPSSLLYDLNEANDISNSSTSQSVLTYQYVKKELPLNTQLKVSNDYIDISYLQYTYCVLDNDDSDVKWWCFQKLSVAQDESFYPSYDIIWKDGYNADENYYYIDSRYLDIYSNDNFYSINGIDLLYSKGNLSSFVFNKDFNYNAPFGIDRNMPSSPVPPVGVSGTYLDFDTGLFLSNGQYFDKIRWNFRNNTGQIFYLFTGEEIIDSHSFYGWTWVSIEYMNTQTEVTIEVCSRVTSVGLLDGAYVTFYQNNSLWVLDSYRYIDFLEPISNDLLDDIRQFNNNNQYSYNGGGVGGEINNIFTLIASAFTGLLPILTIYILPGITIGTLLFIPLVALLVFAIIRIIKK